MKETFIHKNFNDASCATIEWCNEILVQYRALGYDLTTRQVYYQLVAKDLIPNNIKSYNRIQRIISEGRKAGLIDWGMIVDRTRSVRVNSHWNSPAQVVRSAAYSFAIDKWENQPNYIEVMVEKEALAGILRPVCREVDIPFTANKGYSSDSAMYRAGKRIERRRNEGKEIYILYLGDHDPSGIDMDRDIIERLQMFSGVDLELKRLALLMRQINEMDVPENPAKTSDSRYDGYVVEFGTSSWELDAVEPQELARIVEDAVVALRDEDIWNQDLERETEMRQELEEFADSYEDKDD